MRTFADITGQKSGRLTAVWPIGRNQGGHLVWLCFCDCGSFRPIIGEHFRDRHTQSCGCLRREISARRSTRQFTTHGRTGTPEHRCFTAAKNRCRNPRNKDFAYYGGRGIKFKFASFEQFLSEVGPKPAPRYSIERINNDGNYEPGNVRWATLSEQNKNKRRRAA